jgi:hypothetical protein
MRFSPFDAISDRQDTHITWSHILKASVQRLAFYRRQKRDLRGAPPRREAMS